MSVVEYCKLKHQCTKEINWEFESELLILTYKDLTSCNSEDEITDVNSFLTKLEERSLLGIDRFHVLKDLLKGMRKWDLLRMVDEFEIKRKDYKQFLEKISRALDESNELQRLILICKRQNLIAHDREEHIGNVNALFTELEKQNNLGIGNLNILKNLATEVEKPDLCRLVDEFDEKRKQEDDAERKRKEWEDYKQRARAQAASVLVGGINIGERLIGVVTPLCTFRNVTGGAVVVTTWMVLRRSPSMEAFVNAFKEAVLPFGNCLRAISEGSIRFTLQAENISALDALWQSYQDATLQKNLQEFLVTEEIKQLAGGEVTLTVYIDEDEYRNAIFDLMISGKEEIKLEEKSGLKDRASSDSDLLKKRNMTTSNTKDPFPERKFFPLERKVRVEENLWEIFSEITPSSDSGAGTWSRATSEYGFDEGPWLVEDMLIEEMPEDSNLTENLKLTTMTSKDPFREGMFLPFGTKVSVEESLWEAFSDITPPSDSGSGAWSGATSEYEFGEAPWLLMDRLIEEMPEDSSLPEILKRDRLKKLDQVDGSIKDAIENWNSILGAYKDAYPTEGRKYHIIGKELKRIRITLRTFRENEKRWINAESTLTTSITSQATIQKLERFMHLISGEDYFGKPTSEDKTRIRVLARKVRNLKGMDVFSYLRRITPSGTTGPRLPDNLSINEIPKDREYYVSVFLKCQYSEMRHQMRGLDYSNEKLVNVLAKRHDLRTVGELYDFLCEHGLPHAADVL